MDGWMDRKKASKQAKKEGLKAGRKVR